MNATDRSVFARFLTRASTDTDLDEDAALETVTDFLPEFVAEFTDKPNTFKMDEQRMQQFFEQVHDRYGLNFNENYIQQHFAGDHFQHAYHYTSKEIAAEKRNANSHIGRYLETVLSIYTSQDKINELKVRYNSDLWHLNPERALEKSPNNQNLLREKALYDQYIKGSDRAGRLLKYLNDNRINARIDIDDSDNKKIAVYLPEHNDLKVTLMADDPKEIGSVTTWNNSYVFSRNNRKNANVDDLQPEAIVDMLINPTNQIKNIDSIYVPAGHAQYTNLQVDKSSVPIFVTSFPKATKTLRDFNQESATAEINDTDNDEEEAVKITHKDKTAEIQARYKDYKYHKIDTPEAIKAEHDNHGLYATIKQQAAALGLTNVEISKNDHGVYRFKYEITNKSPMTGKVYTKHNWGIIGGYIPPEPDGSNKLVINGKLRGYSVPGMRGYIDTKTGELKVKRFSSILREQVRKSMLDQVMNTNLHRAVQSYSALDNLYTTDAYSTIIDKGVNSPEYEKALIKTLSNRVRLSNDVIAAGNAYNEDPDHVKAQESKLRLLPVDQDNARRVMMATRDLRTIPEDWQKYVDREMTGIGKTMGASLFLGSDVTINPDGSLSAPTTRAYAKSALHELPLFKYDIYDPADRNIMAFNQAIRNVPLDQVNVAMMTMSGYTENDAAVVTAKYANNHKIMGSMGQLRPLRRGDKITDLHGNKSTISEIIDPNEKDPDRQKKLAREIAIVKANPDLDVIVNPYSSISRVNTGSIHEMQDNGLTQLNSPEGYNIDLSKVSMGKEVYAVCVGQRVDEKTRIYDKDDYYNGDSRRFSHQLAAGAAGADLPKLLNFVYKNTTEKGWPKFFDDLHVLGYDIDKQHQVGYFDYEREDAVKMAIPTDQQVQMILHKTPTERKKLENTMFKSSFRAAYEKAQADGGHRPIVMPLRHQYKNAAGNMTDKIVVPYDQIKADAEKSIKMGTQVNKVSSPILNKVKRIFNYDCGIQQDYQPVLDENGQKQYNDKGRLKTALTYTPEKATQLVNSLSSLIIARDFGSDNIIKSEIFSAPLPDSATAVLTPDPNLDLDEIAVGVGIYNNLHLMSPDELALLFRDPVLRPGGLRAFHVTPDKTLTGVAINPVNTKSLDGDFDGDTVGMGSAHDKEVQKEIVKQMPSHNLLNTAAKHPESYLETGLELQGSLYRQHDVNAQADLKQPTVSADTVRAIMKEAYQSDAAYGIGIDARTEDSYLDSLSELIESGAKGHYERDKAGAPLRDANNRVVSKDLQLVQHYYDGERTAQDMHGSMVGLAVKVDGVGPAGSVQQKMLWAGRDMNPKDIMDFTYLATQAALQAKHDPVEAVKRMHAELGPIPKLMSGQLPEGQYNPKLHMPNATFVNLTDDLYNNQLGLSVNTDVIKGVAEIITNDKGTIMPDSDRVEKADPIDLLAYKPHDGVVKTLDHAIAQDKKIAAGRYTRCFSMPEELCSDRVLGQYYKSDQEEQQREQKSRELQAAKLSQEEQNALNQQTILTDDENVSEGQNMPSVGNQLNISQNDGPDLDLS